MKEATIDSITFMKIYIQLDALQPTDDLINGIADYYSDDFVLTLNQSAISQIKGFTGMLVPTLLYNGTPTTSFNYTWATSDSSVATIDSNGNYTIVGNSGNTCNLTCSMSSNSNVVATSVVTVIDSVVSNKSLVISPVITKLDLQITNIDSIRFRL